MEDFEQYIDDKDDAGARRAAEQVKEGLAGMRLESRLRAVAAERAAWQRRARRIQLLVALALLFFVAGACYYFFRKKENAPTPPPLQPPPVPQQISPPINNTPPNFLPSKEKKPRQPMVQSTPDGPLRSPRYRAPNVPVIRGYATNQQVQKDLLDQIWYTDYPLTGLQLPTFYAYADQLLQQRNFKAAFRELGRLERVQADSMSRQIERRNKKRLEEDNTYQPVFALPAPNDTLVYLRAYCSLEMGESGAALVGFNRASTVNPAWTPQIQWYRALSLALSGEKAQALEVFREIAAQKKHPYQREAEKAVRIFN
jgi:tetratricopeptide (TPR) repeat protein